VTNEMPDNQAEHTLRTREAYDRLAAVWSSTTDEGPFNAFLERPALRALVPGTLHGATAGTRQSRKFRSSYVADAGGSVSEAMHAVSRRRI
jgi:hypothetical protein